MGNDEAGILETGRFLAKRPSAKYATQSGPMLVIDGAIHPAFIIGSTDRKLRNGVGVSSPTGVHFVITKGWVNFHEFARFFRDGLGCDNALFLPGKIGELPPPLPSTGAVSFRGRQPFIQLPRLKLGYMSGRRQMQLLLCAVCLLATVIIVVSAILPPVGASGSAAFEQPNFSSQAKTPLHLANSLELDIPAPGSIESPWDAGSIWDEEASAYDLTQSAQQ